MRWTAGTLIVVLLVGGGYYYYRQRAATAAAQAAPRYVTAQVSRGNIDSVVTGTGPVASSNGLTVKANVQGTVGKVLVSDGARVSPGTVVVELQNESLTASLAQARIDLEKARADLDSLLHPEPTAVRAQQLKLENARLTLQQRQADVASLQIASPCGCVVVDVKVAEGDPVGNGALLLTLYDDARPAVVAQVSQAFATHIRPGQPARVSVAGLGVKEGQVALVGTSASPGARDSTVAITVALPSWFGIRPGMLAQVSLTPDLNPSLGQVQVNGTVATADVKEVRARVPADAVTRLAVKPGDRVGPGDPLIQMRNDALQLQLQQAANEVATQELNLHALLNPLADASGAARQAQARVQAAETTYHLRTGEVNDLIVKAPVGGTVSALAVKPGDRVTAGTSLFRVADYTGMQVDISVDELDIAKVRPGQPATITLDALPGKTYRGKVLKVNPEGQFRNDIATFTVTVQFEETAGLMAGMNATVNIQVESRQNVLRVPAQAVTVRQGRAFVRVYKGEAEQPEVRPVDVGLRTAEWVEIVGGLNEGDRIVVAEVRQNQQRAGVLIPGVGGGIPGGGGGGGFPGGGGGGGAIFRGGGGGGGGGANQVRTPQGGQR